MKTGSVVDERERRLSREKEEEQRMLCQLDDVRRDFRRGIQNSRKLGRVEMLCLRPLDRGVAAHFHRPWRRRFVRREPDRH